MHRLCMYHLLVQGWKIKVSAAPRHLRSRCEGEAYDWLASWFTELETAAELELSRRAFFDWLEKNDTPKGFSDPAMVQRIETFTEQSLLHHKVLFASPYFVMVEGMGNKTTSAAEAMNSSTKRGELAVNPSMKVNTAATTMVQKSNKLADRKAVSDAKSISATPTWSCSATATTLTKYMEGLAVGMFERRKMYMVVRVSHSTWMVYFGSPSEARDSSPRPRYLHTRLVKLDEQ